MPKKAEENLKETAKKRGYGKERANAYVYGGLRNTGWKPNHNTDGTTGEIDYTPPTVIHHKD
jgi:hypothetical protein